MKRALTLFAAIGLTSSVAHAQPDSPPPALPTEPGVLDTAPPPEAPPPEMPPPDVAIPEESIDPALLNAAAAGGEAPMSEEELKALGFGTGAESVVDTSLKFFGFADFTVLTVPMKRDSSWRQQVGRHATMYVGNINLFFSKNFNENVRTLGEVRFLFAPHGSRDDVHGGYIENVATDHADFDRPVHWGGVEIERLYLEWQIIQNLAVRVGMFLTPYGIWNVDHGTPLYIPPLRPYVIGSALFPERQTGFEFFGKKEISEYGAIGYHMTLSNGTGPTYEIRDLDDNKAVGGRLFYDYKRLGQLRIGGSIYYGTYSNTTSVQGLTVDAMGKRHLTNTEDILEQYRTLALAADIQWKYKGLQTQAEVITQQRRYNEKGRVGTVNPLLGQTVFPKDDLSWGVYGLIGYRFKWLGVMPYGMVSAISQLGENNLMTETTGFNVGLNIQPLDGVVVKADYTCSFWPDDSIIAEGTLHMLQFQTAWAF